MSYSSEVLADSPDVYFRLSETGAGPFVDSGAAGQNAAIYPTSIVTATSLLATDANAAASFDFNGNLWRATTSYTLNNTPLTVEAWVNPSSTNQNAGAAAAIVTCMGGGGANGWGMLYQLPGCALYFITYGVQAYVFTATVYPSGFATHVVMVFQSSFSVDLYVNGAFSQTITFGSGMNSSTGVVEIGDQGSTGLNPIAVIDEVAVYKSALSPARIAAHYAAGVGTITVRMLALTGVGA